MSQLIAWRFTPWRGTFIELRERAVSGFDGACRASRSRVLASDPV
jgi:hypothetical protein